MGREFCRGSESAWQEETDIKPACQFIILQWKNNFV